MKSITDLEKLFNNPNTIFEKEFPKLHQFAKKPPFKTRPLSFSSFKAYCGKHEIRSGGDNEQTIQRACEYIRLVCDEKLLPEDALAEAWEKFPVIYAG